MLIERAQQLAQENGKKLIWDSGDDCFILYNHEGEYEDELYKAQIAEMKEEDFVEYYLDIIESEE